MLAMAPHPENNAQDDFSRELARNLPRSIGWLPTISKGARSLFARWQADRKIEHRVSVHAVEASIYVRAKDLASIDFTILVGNCSKRRLEPDRLELSSIMVGGRTVYRNSDMIQVRSEIPTRSTQKLWFSIELTGSGVGDVARGIPKASNLWCSPQTSVRIYGDILFLAGHERFRKSVNFDWYPVACNVPNDVYQALVEQI